MKLLVRSTKIDVNNERGTNIEGGTQVDTHGKLTTNNNFADTVATSVEN